MPTDAKTATALQNELKACETVTQLFKLASSDEFHDAAARLSADSLEELRHTYIDCQRQLDGKVKLEEFDNQVIAIIGCEWWHSDTYDNDGVSVRFTPDNEPNKRRKALTSSTVIVRFCNQQFARTLPSPENPVRAFIHLEPVSDPERAARGQRIWNIRRMPDYAAKSTGAPF